MNLTREKLLGLVVLVPVLVIAMMLHELAHGFVAYKLGDPTAKRMGRLSFNPLRHLDPVGTAMFFITYLFFPLVFGWAKPVPVSPYYFKNRQRGMALVGLAGPVTNFILAVVFILILNAVRVDPAGLAFEVLFLASQVNLVLGIFNLIPVPPLDGSRVVGAFLPRNAYEKWVALDQFGMVFAVLVLLIVIYSGILRLALQGFVDLFLTNYQMTIG